ncbi:MAG: response regulator transcription factor [Gammaproteobacteria bacterium]|nr:response regulator transcription factor [Gammaproteobacteria bacterium]
MKILITDDEQPARVRLRRLIEELQGANKLYEAGNANEALRVCERETPDVALLDIRMPGMSGLELAQHLIKLAVPPAIIFTTAYDEYALAAFETHAVDYLLKPIRQERLAKALDAAKRLNRVQLQQVTQDITQASKFPTATQRSHISARVGSELRLVAIDEIRYFLAEDKYVSVRHAEGQLLVEDSLKMLAKEFADRFIRIHRNALVALHYVAALESDGQSHCRVRIKDSNETLDVSRRHLPFVRKALKQL